MAIAFRNHENDLLNYQHNLKYTFRVIKSFWITHFRKIEYGMRNNDSNTLSYKTIIVCATTLTTSITGAIVEEEERENGAEKKKTWKKNSFRFTKHISCILEYISYKECFEKLIL